MRVRLLLIVFLLGCRSTGVIGTLCDSGDCRPRVDCGPDGCGPAPCVGEGCNPPVCTPLRCDPGCDAASCQPPACDGGSCASDACAGGSCASDACAGGSSEVDACAQGACDAGGCDAGRCEPPGEPPPECDADSGSCCTTDSDCDAWREERLCDPAARQCVECRQDAHCGGSEPYCVRGDCEECRSDADCPGGLRCRTGDCRFID
jgi:Cys-rich repeat protein